jgi:hypothetical protein
MTSRDSQGDSPKTSSSWNRHARRRRRVQPHCRRADRTELLRSDCRSCWSVERIHLTQRTLRQHQQAELEACQLFQHIGSEPTTRNGADDARQKGCNTTSEPVMHGAPVSRALRPRRRRGPRGTYCMRQLAAAGRSRVYSAQGWGWRLCVSGARGAIARTLQIAPRLRRTEERAISSASS